MSKSTVWAIIGGGNGGQSMAGHLALMGYQVRLYDIFPQTVEAINAQGGIHVTGVVEGYGRLAFATTKIEEAINGADILAIVVPAVAHRAIAEACLPYLSDGQIVILHPGATCGAFEFRKALDDGGCRAKVPIAETNSLLYACRSPEPGHASILGIKQDLLLATLPANQNQQVLNLVQEAFPQVKGADSVLETSLGNANAVMHPAPTILNTSLIESQHDWLYYWEGVTPTIGRFVEELDQERLAVGRAYGLELDSIMDFYRQAYQVDAPNLAAAVRKNLAYEKIQGQKDLRTRYLQEDIPTGLIPMIELGKLRGIDVNRMEIIAKLGEMLLGEDFFTTGRTLKNLGLSNLSPEAFTTYVQTGERPAAEETIVA